jgi:hypothetical protein
MRHSDLGWLRFGARYCVMDRLVAPNDMNVKGLFPWHISCSFEEHFMNQAPGNCLGLQFRVQFFTDRVHVSEEGK